MKGLRALVAAHARALALERDAPPVRGWAHTALLLFHLLALLVVTRLAHWPVWAVLAVDVAFAVLLIVGRPGGPRAWFRKSNSRSRGAEAFAPLIVVYLVAAARLAVVYGLQRPASTDLSYEAAVVFAAVWAGLMALRRAGRLRWAVLAAGVLAGALWVGQLWRLAPAGVTGSDPLAYVQMAVDIAERGTARHAFPLAVLAARLGLPTLPTTPVGYVLPNAEGLAPTVWPPGFSVLLAVADRLGGERAMLTFNVLMALVSALLTAWLAALLAPAGWRRLPVVVGAAAVFALATSAEQFLRLSAPLADGAAQVFTALAVTLTLWSVRRTTPATRLRMLVALGAGVGAALGAAYAVRYTQVLIGPGLALAAWVGLKHRRQRLAFLGALALAAALVALPDGLYRVSLYGSPLRFGTGELALFSWQALPEALARLGPEFTQAGEFGWLWPLVLVGAAYAWRRNRLALSAVVLCYGPLFLFHIWYPFVRVRDLLALYVPLAGLAALGGAVAVGWLWNVRRARWGWTALRVAAVALVLLGAGWRTRLVASWDAGFFTFGYLRPEQRLDLESLQTLTEPNAVIAASLNSGAIELYGERLAVRPGNQLQPGASWTEAEWLVFAAALRAEGRPLYVLMDSSELDAPLAAVQRAYGATEAGALNVPVFFVGGGSRNETVVLWRVDD